MFPDQLNLQALWLRERCTQKIKFMFFHAGKLLCRACHPDPVHQGLWQAHALGSDTMHDLGDKFQPEKWFA